MTPWYATNARQLLDARRQGMAPNGPVIVSLVGGTFHEPTLYAKPDMPVERLDWRMLVNLTVWVHATAQARMDWLTETVWRSAHCRPAELCIEFHHEGREHAVDCGSGHHLPAIADIPAVHRFWWLPVNVGGTGLGYRLKRALLAQHPSDVML